VSYDDACDLPLFALARVDDPSTSTEAAAAVSPKLAGLRLEFLRGLAACGGSATANEVARAISDNHSHRESIRKRAGECKRLGLIEDIGSRVCSVTGNRATVYAPTNNPTPRLPQ
jgi:hypothetical protein